MSKSTKMIAALGIVAGLGVAALPLGAVSAGSGTSPQSESVDVTMTVTDGVSIALEGQTLTIGENNAITNVADNTASTAVSASTVAGGPVVRSTNGTKITAAGSKGFSVTVTPSALTAQTDSENHDAIAWSGAAVKQDGDSGYNIYYNADLTSATTLLTAVSNPILTSATGASASIYTAYDFAAATEQAADTYKGTVTYTNTVAD